MTADGLEHEQRKREDWQLAAATGSAYALLESLAAGEGYDAARSHAVVELALAVGRRLGLERVQLANLHWVALLHDVGKLGVSDAILGKPGPLTKDEWIEVRRHADIGERIIGSTPELAHLATSIRAEHERWDGSGYPDGLAGTEIPLISRIVFVCDAYCAMTCESSHRAPHSAADACAALERNAGTQFCPTVTGALLAALAEMGSCS
jgi:HD-GYP domain-containing protein (c-di-GMP phosphodiesterase class II)